jgi:Fe-S-cluster containining protein
MKHYRSGESKITCGKEKQFNYPKNVRFKCSRCALCCGDTKNNKRTILLLKPEASRISRKTSKSLADFAEKVEGFEPYVYCMKKTDDGKCVFLRNDLCSIYEIRPLICRFYPFQLKSTKTGRYAFECTTECPGVGTGPELKKGFFERLFKVLAELVSD